MATGWSTAIEPLGPRYRRLLDRARTTLYDDEQVLALFLAGSVGRSVADPSSDLDLLIFVRDNDLPAFVEGAVELVERVVGPTLLARRLQGGHCAMTTVTPGWERVDLMIVRESSASQTRRDSVTEVFDRADVSSRLSVAPPEPVRDARTVAFLCEEFLRVLGLLEVILSRQEYLVGVEGASLLRGYLRDLLVQESNRPTASVKRLNERLGAEQRKVLCGQPSVEATRESIIEGHLAAARAFLPRAKVLCHELDVTWPQEFEIATSAHLKSRAGITIPA